MDTYMPSRVNTIAYRAVYVVLLLVTVLANSSAIAQTASDSNAPALKFRSPFGGPIWRTDVDQSENFIVVSNASNAAAIWSIANPTEPSIARVPLRNEQRKRARAVAMAPSGLTIAYSVPPLVDDGGQLRSGTSLIYIVRRSTGALERVIGDIPTRPQALRFSPDGQYLAAVLSSGCGLRVWRTEDWQLVANDDQGYGGGDPFANRCCRSQDGSVCDVLPDTTDVRFIRGARQHLALITSGDTGLRLYERVGEGFAVQKSATPSELGLVRPEGIAISPDERRIAVGDRRGDLPRGEIRIRVGIFDANDLRPLGRQLEIRESSLRFSGFILATPGNAFNSANLHRVAWVKADGREYIFAGGDLGCEYLNNALIQRSPETNQDSCMARWTVGEENNDPIFIPVGSDQVMDIVAMPRRGAVLVATQKLIALLRPDGQPLPLDGGKTLFVRNRIADFRDGRIDFKISNDARVVEFRDYRSLPTGESRLTFDLNRLEIKPGNSGGLTEIAPNQDSNIIINWRNATAAAPPQLWGRPLSGPAYWKDEIYRSVAVIENQRSILMGSSEFLRVIDYADETRPVACSEPTTAEVFRVNVTPDGRIAVTGNSDGTLRWYRIVPQGRQCLLELLLSVYLVQDQGPGGVWHWVAWLPSGPFAWASNAPIGMEWQTADAGSGVRVTPFLDLASRWYSTAQVRAAVMPQSTSRDPADIRRTQAPDQQIVRGQSSPANKLVRVRDSSSLDDVNKETWSLNLEINTSDLPKPLQIRIADTPVSKTYRGQRFGPDEPIVFSAPILPDDDVVVEIEVPRQARIAGGEKYLCLYLDSRAVDCPILKWTGEVFRPAKRRLWAVLVGISRYDESLLNLRFAANDALDLAQLFIRDYENRFQSSATGIPPDYQEIHINLVVSPFTEEAKGEVAAMEANGRVRTFAPTKAGINAALKDVVDRMNATNRQEIGDDVLLFYYSGHGAIYPDAAGTQRTVLATVNTSRSATASEIESTSLISVDIFRQIDRAEYGQKIVVLDACRSLTTLSGSELASGGRFRSELERLSLSVDFFFSSETGQQSVEIADLAHNKARNNSGNSLLTYVLLESLTAGKQAAQGLARVRVDDVSSYVQDFFLNEDKNSRIMQLQAKHQWAYLQKPTIMRARSTFSSGIIRTLDRK